ncbi:peptidase [Bradyrhizobium sp. SSBR45G]|uniref:PepSY-associated TM helix domain-containing protein n=1 Tax=unclassified Bradyrhizobium TaxID=2631580 RepID=UPI002342901F|nr:MULTISPECIES: PepSY-associated TM helix domain-containing protein [unclassified Bradyrhizobium]GLH81842.1 peptidase [Bradyrhizobium sp. SSBR45G]GLH89321.1 peptidase [Bradyrhizobium sp. SSBR45R]
MNKQLLLKLHRWISLTFALPLLVIIVTGLILSFEPMAQVAAVKPGSVDPARVVALIKQYDPDGKARGISINPSSQHLTLQGRPATEVDMTTGNLADKPAMGSVFQWARMTHEHLIGIEGLTTISTIAMISVMIIGILMGLPRLRNTLSGWHKGAAWFTLPLILLSPLTGLLLDASNSFFGAPPAAAKRISLPEAVSLIARDHDLATVNMIGNRGGRMIARIIEGDELRAYAVTADGLSALPRNWVRLLHEGNWSLVGSAANVLISVVLLGLLLTGVLIWTQRRLRRPKRTRELPAAVASSMPS